MKRAMMAAGALMLAGCGGDAHEGATLQGYAEADYLYLSPREPGFVETLAVKEGDQVDVGAIVFTLDRDRTAAGVERAEAERLASARSVTAAAQAVAEARAQAELAAANYKRTRALSEKGFVSKARVDEDEAALEAARATVRRAEAEQRVIAGQTRAAGADVALAREQAGDREMHAPAAGRVERVFRRPGEFAGAGEPVVALLPPENMKLRFFAPQALLSKLQIGRALDVACDGCPKGMKAKVSFVATEPQFTPPVIYSLEQREKLTFLVEARPDTPAVFRPGQPIDIVVR